MEVQINKAMEVLKNGGVILYPTDTIWGLGCDATDPEAVKKEAAESLAQAAQKEMVFLCGFDMHLLNRFLAAVKKGKLKNVELKAMLTPSNRQWSGRHLLQELAAEHVYMKQYGKSVHK